MSSSHQTPIQQGTLGMGGIQMMYVQTTNLQQLDDAIVSI